jgi:hypothetical protein
MAIGQRLAGMPGGSLLITGPAIESLAAHFMRVCRAPMPALSTAGMGFLDPCLGPPRSNGGRPGAIALLPSVRAGRGSVRLIDTGV